MSRNIQYKKLTDICEIITGEWGTEIKENSQNIVSVIRTTNFLNNGKIDIQNKELVKREMDKNKIEQKKLKKGDIIIEKSGGSPNQPVGRVVFFNLNSNEIFLCNNFTSILRIKENINSKLCPEVWEELFSKADHNQLSSLGNKMSYGVCYDVQDVNKINYMAGFDVEDIEKAKKLGLEIMEIPEAKYACIELVGKVPNSIHVGWKFAMETFLPENGYKHSGTPDFEVYFEGDMYSDDYVMELWIPIVKED